jgi:hypothetical protein
LRLALLLLCAGCWNWDSLATLYHAPGPDLGRPPRDLSVERNDLAEVDLAWGADLSDFGPLDAGAD